MKQSQKQGHLERRAHLIPLMFLVSLMFLALSIGHGSSRYELLLDIIITLVLVLGRRIWTPAVCEKHRRRALQVIRNIPSSLCLGLPSSLFFLLAEVLEGLLLLVGVALLVVLDDTGSGTTGASLANISRPRTETACCKDIHSTEGAAERTMAEARVASTAKLEEGPIMMDCW